MNDVIEMKVDEVENPSVLGEYWRKLTFNDNKLNKEFVQYDNEDWMDGEAPVVFYDYFDFLNSKEYGSACPSMAYNVKLGLWAAWFADELVLYHEESDVCVSNRGYKTTTEWNFF